MLSFNMSHSSAPLGDQVNWGNPTQLEKSNNETIFRNKEMPCFHGYCCGFTESREEATSSRKHHRRAAVLIRGASDAGT